MIIVEQLHYILNAMQMYCDNSNQEHLQHWPVDDLSTEKRATSYEWKQPERMGFSLADPSVICFIYFFFIFILYLIWFIFLAVLRKSFLQPCTDIQYWLLTESFHFSDVNRKCWKTKIGSKTNQIKINARVLYNWAEETWGMQFFCS